MDQEKQVSDYCVELETKYRGGYILLRLTPNSSDPPKESIDPETLHELKKEGKLRRISYCREIHQWLYWALARGANEGEENCEGNRIASSGSMGTDEASLWYWRDSVTVERVNGSHGPTTPSLSVVTSSDSACKSEALLS